MMLISPPTGQNGGNLRCSIESVGQIHRKQLIPQEHHKSDAGYSWGSSHNFPFSFEPCRPPEFPSSPGRSRYIEHHLILRGHGVRSLPLSGLLSIVWLLKTRAFLLNKVLYIAPVSFWDGLATAIPLH